MSARPCPDCNGRGYHDLLISRQTCDVCKGTRTAPVARTYDPAKVNFAWIAYHGKDGDPHSYPPGKDVCVHGRSVGGLPDPASERLTFLQARDRAKGLPSYDKTSWNRAYLDCEDLGPYSLGAWLSHVYKIVA